MILNDEGPLSDNFTWQGWTYITDVARSSSCPHGPSGKVNLILTKFIVAYL